MSDAWFVVDAIPFIKVILAFLVLYWFWPNWFFPQGNKHEHLLDNFFTGLVRMTFITIVLVYTLALLKLLELASLFFGYAFIFTGMVILRAKSAPLPRLLN